MIKHLQDRARLPRLGVIRLGVKQRNAEGKEYPVEVSYFVVPEELRGVLPDRPTRIPVLFPSDDPARVVTADYIRYGGKLLTLKCDGERFTEIPRSGQEIVGACRKQPGEPCPCGAKALARLNVIVLDGPLGVFQVLIGGEQRIADLLVELGVYRSTLGRLTDIVFELERVPTDIQVRNARGERLSRTGWPVHVRCNFTAKQALAARGRDILALPASLVTAEAEEESAPDEPTAETTHGGATAERVPDSPASVAERAPAPVAASQAADPGAEFDRRVPPDDPIPWDVSVCFAEAKKLGAPTVDYHDYLVGVYREDPDHLGDDAIDEQRQMFEAATSDAARAELKKAIAIVAKKKRDQKIEPRPRGQQALV